MSSRKVRSLRGKLGLKYGFQFFYTISNHGKDVSCTCTNILGNLVWERQTFGILYEEYREATRKSSEHALRSLFGEIESHNSCSKKSWRVFARSFGKESWFFRSSLAITHCLAVITFRLVLINCWVGRYLYQYLVYDKWVIAKSLILVFVGFFSRFVFFLFSTTKIGEIRICERKKETFSIVFQCFHFPFK